MKTITKTWCNLHCSNTICRTKAKGRKRRKSSFREGKVRRNWCVFHLNLFDDGRIYFVKIVKEFFPNPSNFHPLLVTKWGNSSFPFISSYPNIALPNVNNPSTNVHTWPLGYVFSLHKIYSRPRPIQNCEDKDIRVREIHYHGNFTKLKLKFIFHKLRQTIRID